MAKVDTVESVVAAGNKTGAPREYMGNPPVAAKNTSAETGKQGLTAAHSAAAADPAVSPYLSTVRPHVLASDKDGAAYGIRAAVHKPVDPVAAPTLANAKVIPSVINRTRPDFASGASS